MKPEITLVRGEDWEGLYLDGVLAREDHSLDVRAVLNELGMRWRLVRADDEWLRGERRLPLHLGDVKVT